MVNFDPNQQRIPINFFLIDDDLYEGTEAFQLVSSQLEGTPEFSGPTVLSPSTFIIIEDNDGKRNFNLLCMQSMHRRYTVVVLCVCLSVCLSHPNLKNTSSSKVLTCNT